MEAIILFFGMLTWFVWSLMNGEIARAKSRRTFGVIAFSIIFSPLLGYLYILAVPRIEKGHRNIRFKGVSSSSPVNLNGEIGELKGESK